MSFYLGKPILVMSVLAVACGTGLALRSSHQERPDLLVWVFAEIHQKTYAGDGTPSTQPTLVEQFQKRTGKTVGVELVATRSEDVRLVSMFMSDSKDVPDVVELEISSVAKYFRPPTNDIGLLPLNDLLEKSGWMDKLVKARLAPWSKNGVIFGVPHDVHPVTLVYRDDLFRQAGIDLPAMKTWPEFQQACLDFQDYWKAQGVRNRHAIELMNSSSDHLIPMLLQRHLNPIDGNGTIELAEEKFIETVAFYAQCIAGPRKIASQSPAAAGGLARDLIDGNICIFMTPDWRVDYIKEYAPGLAGKMRMMAMPVFEPGDARTATWGGTMMGIPRNCKDPQAAWKLIEFLYFSKEGIAARRRYSAILPPVKTLWDDPIYQRRDPYFGGQQTDLLFIEMAKELPARYITPATAIANGYLSKVIVDAASFVENHPGEHDALVAHCRTWLTEIAGDLRRRIEHGKFE
jgi:arabinosaccharide transport system substrate-binding protein